MKDSHCCWDGGSVSPMGSCLLLLVLGWGCLRRGAAVGPRGGRWAAAPRCSPRRVTLLISCERERKPKRNLSLR